MDIRGFYGDKETKDVVLNYLEEFFAQEVVERTFKDGKMNAEAMYEAHEIILAAFAHLDTLYGPKSDKKVDQDNPAR